MLREKMVFPNVSSESITEEQEQHIDNFHHNIGLFASELSKVRFSEKPPYSKIKSFLAECKKSGKNL